MRVIADFPVVSIPTSKTLPTDRAHRQAGQPKHRAIKVSVMLIMRLGPVLLGANQCDLWSTKEQDIRS